MLFFKKLFNFIINSTSCARFVMFFKTCLNYITIFFSYWKDYFLGHYRGTIKNGRHEDGSIMTEPLEFLERFHIVPYYLLMLIIISSWEYYHFFFFVFLIFELLILLTRPFFTHIWMLRIILFFVFWSIFNLRGESLDGYWPLWDTFVWLNNVFGFDFVSLTTFNNQLIDIDSAVFFVLSYFLTITLPYIFMGLVIVLPAVSCLFLMSFGFLIGYELAGIFAALSVCISFFSSCYLMFIYPSFRSSFVKLIKYYNEDCKWSIVYDQYDQLVFFCHGWSPIARAFTGMNSPLDDVNVVQLTNCESFNLTLDFGDFINTPFFWAPFVFVCDSVSIIVIFVVTFISTIVHFYSIVYMKNDPHKIRFFAFLSLFTFFMIVLVLAGNLVMLYIGWEGVGLSSFLLIGFWYTRVSAVKAALKAILINKIGDLLIILAAGLITFYTKGSTLIATFFFTVPERAASMQFFCNFTVLDVIACSLVISAFVKSAQIFFHTWLADAMEGPTPVSALLHAATMVTAGVYLVIRFSCLIDFSIYAKALLFFGGFFTIIFSSLVACTQYDIKKIIAYSTCSQLGLMFFACGLSAYDLALFHFFNHAFFKCLLFLLAGIIIHELRNEQDIRKMGGLAVKMPFVFMAFTLASLSLVGFPGFSGAVSKDLILHLANYTAIEFISIDVKCSLLLFFSNIMIYLTMAYSVRVFYYVFLAPANFRKNTFSNSYKDVGLVEPIYTWIILILSIMSIFSGKWFKHMFILTDFNYISIHKEISVLNIRNRDFLFDNDWKFIAFFITLHALALSVYAVYYVKNNRKKIIWYLAHDYKLYYVFKFFNRKCYFDDIYNIFLARPFIKLSYVYNRAVEDGIFRAFLLFIYKILKMPARLQVISRKHYLLDHLYVATFSFLIIFVFAFFV